MPQRSAAEVEREEMRFLTPAEIIALADAIRPLSNAGARRRVRRLADR
jgi:hypothetical protein